MSLNVYLNKKVHVSYDSCKTHEEQLIQIFNANITHNLNKMADECGLYKVLWRPDELNLIKAKELIPLLKVGLFKLKKEPEKFKKFNPSNGWGSYEGLLNFVENYLNACQDNPEAFVQVSR